MFKGDGSGWRENAAWLVGGLFVSFLCAWFFEYSWKSVNGEIEGFWLNAFFIILGIPAGIFSIPAKLSLIIPGLLFPGFLDQFNNADFGAAAPLYRNGAIVVGIAFAGLFWKEIGAFIGRMTDRSAQGAGYISALSDPSNKKPKVKASELQQNTENTDLSAELQKELNRIERLKAKLKNTDVE